MKKTLFLLALIFCVSCEENVQQDNASVEQDTLEFAEPLTVETSRIVNLLPQAEEAVSEWLAYATAQNEVQALRTATGEQIIQNSKPLQQIMENLYATLPAALDQSAVRARANVLLTKSVILHQASNKKNKSPGEIYQLANDIIFEFDNFKIQLNELYLKSPGDFDLDLDREFEESQDGDSLLKSPGDNVILN